MKNILFSFAALSIVAMTPAFSTETTHLTTKGYVDTGLKEVYNRIKALNTATQNDLNELTLYVGAPATETQAASGLTAQVEALSNDVNSMEGRIVYYGDGRGVLVTDDRKVSITGLTSSTGTNDKIYVFRNNIATELEVADTWSIPEPEQEGD